MIKQVLIPPFGGSIPPAPANAQAIDFAKRIDCSPIARTGISGRDRAFYLEIRAALVSMPVADKR
ncbi:hypothetical protein [Bradyrhizobium sp. CER78]|uniref:hypothetical protein n=1 Tax=Bradyrhizobium sp. CER78 TaxID=3039162 RepID=UPI00244751F6|nr:hypothetical protein [Bradyrhizobium sp. CER78]MDH2384396.1 hypothetical protein [Bradyrhizobium sp. CER78]